MLEAEGLAAWRGERLVFERVSFKVAPGEALLLTGPNGTGKSTLLRLLAGLVPLAAGRLLWEGADALADLSEHAGRVAYVGHLDAIKPGLTVAENLAFWGAPTLRGRTRRWTGPRRCTRRWRCMISGGWPICRRGCSRRGRSGGSR